MVSDTGVYNFISFASNDNSFSKKYGPRVSWLSLLSPVAAHGARIDVAVYANDASTAYNLGATLCTLDLEMGIILKTHIAVPPLVDLRLGSPARNDR